MHSNTQHKTVLVRYGKFGYVGQFKHNEKHIPAFQARAVVQTQRGQELGEIVSPFLSQKHHALPFQDKTKRQPHTSHHITSKMKEGWLIRLASVQDLSDYRHLDADSKVASSFCKEQIRTLDLPMKLVDVEHLLGGESIIFYFQADGRVDFRPLVRNLQKEYQTGIQLIQIGPRDQAKLLGDCDTCGQELCCKRFLNVLQPVSMRMAKNQGVPLNNSKLSGVCGRLKCCLRYENLTYEELAKRLPKIGSKVNTSQGVGKVLDTMTLTQLVKIQLFDTDKVVAVNVEELIDTSVQSTPKPQKRSSRHKSQRPKNKRDHTTTSR